MFPLKMSIHSLDQHNLKNSKEKGARELKIASDGCRHKKIQENQTFRPLNFEISIQGNVKFRYNICESRNFDTAAFKISIRSILKFRYSIQDPPYEGPIISRPDLIYSTT